MKFTRTLDLIILLLCSDVLTFGVSAFFILLLGPEDSEFLQSLVYMIGLWVKFGLFLLMIRNIPFRMNKPESTVEIKKVLVLALAWPLVLFNKPSN